MNIAIIDSGVDVSIIDESSFLGGANMFYTDGKISVSTEIDDQNGHGTAIYKIIVDKKRRDKFYIVKILNDKNESSSELLCYALESLQNIDIKCIVCCLSPGNTEYISRLGVILDRLSKQGKIVIASVKNERSIGLYSLPLVFDNIIGVKGEIKYKNIYEYDSNVYVFWRNYPVYIWGLKNQLLEFKGNSCATARFVKKNLEMIEKADDVYSLRNNLQQWQVNNTEDRVIKNPSDFQELLKLYQRYGGSVENQLWKTFKSMEYMSEFFIESCHLLKINYNLVVLERESLESIKKYYNNLIYYQR